MSLSTIASLAAFRSIRSNDQSQPAHLNHLLSSSIISSCNDVTNASATDSHHLCLCLSVGLSLSASLALSLPLSVCPSSSLYRRLRNTEFPIKQQQFPTDVVHSAVIGRPRSHPACMWRWQPMMITQPTPDTHTDLVCF